MINVVKIECPTEISLKSLEVNVLTTRGHQLIFNSPDVDLQDEQYRGVRGILSAIREGHQVNVTLPEPQTSTGGCNCHSSSGGRKGPFKGGTNYRSGRSP